MTRHDTIVATATAPGRGGVAIVRVSGPKAPEIAAVVIGSDLPVARRATLARFLDATGEPIDVGLALFFAAPHSYTGEHVVEFHGHGGPVVTECLVKRAVELGARRARPGEFTQRAFLNDKVDLAQARRIEHVQRHAVDVDALAHDIARGAGNCRDDRRVVAREAVQQARFAGVRPARDHHGHALAQEAPLARAALHRREVLAHATEACFEFPVGQEVDLLFRKVDGGLDPGAQFGHGVDEPVHHRRELALQ